VLLACFYAENYFTVKKIHTKNVQAELLFLAQILTKSFGGWDFAPDPIGELTALPKAP